MNSLELRYEKIDSNIGLVHLSGRLDISGVQDIDLQFTIYTSTQRLPVIVNLENVTLITSIGLGMLIRSAKALKRQGIPFILLRPQLQVEKVITMAGLDHYLPMVKELSAAVQHINNSQPSL